MQAKILFSKIFKVRVMVFNDTFKNIYVLSWRCGNWSTGENHRHTCSKSLTNFIT
jgi:hypothetical protein